MGCEIILAPSFFRYRSGDAHNKYWLSIFKNVANGASEIVFKSS